MIEELIDELSGSRYFQSLIWDLDITKSECMKMTSTKLLTNAPSTFQLLMNTIFKPILRKFILVFFDNILIYNKTMEEHLDHLKTVLQVMKDNTLYDKMTKFTFAVLQVEYLDHIIHAHGVSTDPTKIQAMES